MGILGKAVKESIVVPTMVPASATLESMVTHDIHRLQAHRALCSINVYW